MDLYGMTTKLKTMKVQTLINNTREFTTGQKLIKVNQGSIILYNLLSITISITRLKMKLIIKPIKLIQPNKTNYYLK